MYVVHISYRNSTIKDNNENMKVKGKIAMKAE